MKTIILISLFSVVILPESLKTTLTLLMTFIWFLFLICYCYNLYKIRERKIVTNKYSIMPPNNNYSPYIRYLYKGKIDYKVFLLMVIELIIKGSISLKYEKRLYYLVDNKVKDEKLKKSEEYLKHMLFKDIGEDNYVILNNMIKKCNFNSGYLYGVYKIWENVFEFEAAYNRYFKSNKEIVDNSTMFLIISFIICMYNIIFTRKIILAVLIFSIASLLCKYISDAKNREEDAKKEYELWLEFKNYINKSDNNLHDFDASTLENYSLYAYALDSYPEFCNTLEKKKQKDNDIINKSEILKIIDNNAFKDIDYIFSKSIKKLSVKSLVLFARNKGRR